MDYSIRQMTLDDYEQAYSLWDATDGVCLDGSDSRDGITLYLRRNQGFCFVATVGGGLVGTVLCGHEGRRGILRHLVVSPAFRGKGIARDLINHARSALAEEGIRRCNTFVLNSNVVGRQFWARMGWRLLDDDFRLMQITTGTEEEGITTNGCQRTPKVIYIGGSPMVGKSTVARVVASRLQYACVSTDDIGSAVAAVTNETTHPQFHYMGTQDHRDYYASSDTRKLVSDMNDLHASLWPAVRILFENHMSWAGPVVIEGWCLRPRLVSELSGDVAGVFLLGDDALLEERVFSSDFSIGATDRKAMLGQYLERSRLYNAMIQDHVSELGLASIHVSREMSPDEIAAECIRVVSRRGL
jgi:GNAT superfamily N-acetyltransferase